MQRHCMRYLLISLVFGLLAGCGTLTTKPDQYAAVERAAPPDTATLEKLARQHLKDGGIVRLTHAFQALWRQYEDDTTRADIERILWKHWQRLPERSLQWVARRHKNDPTIRAWVALSLAKGHPRQLAQLQKRHPHAIYQAHLLPEMLESMSTRLPPARRIAVFLPLTGRYATIGQVIRKGIVKAALTRHPEVRLTFLDTGSNSIEALHEQTAGRQIDWIIGPLRPQAIRTLSTLTQVPMLGLNSAEIENGYVFPFTTQDEGRQIGQHLQQQGHRFIAIFTAPGRRNQKIAAQLEQYWRSLPGHGVERVDFSGKQRDIRKTLDTLLHVANSKARARYLQSLLGRNLKFNPRARQDLGTLVLATSPGIGAVVNPLLDFYNLRLPLTGTSQFMPKRFSQARLNADLAGMQFPAFLALHRRGPVSTPLEAFGWDALQLTQHFPAPGQRVEQDVMTGILVRDDNRIHRHLVWFKVSSDGRIVPQNTQKPASGETTHDKTSAPQRPAAHSGIRL